MTRAELAELDGLIKRRDQAIEKLTEANIALNALKREEYQWLQEPEAYDDEAIAYYYQVLEQAKAERNQLRDELFKIKEEFGK